MPFIESPAMQQYLQSTDYFDFESPAIKNLCAKVADVEGDKEKAIALYEYVRDGWQYSAYVFHIAKDQMRSSAIALRDSGHCLDKAILLISVYRAINLPARLHLAKVKNHIAVERIVEHLGSDELTPHGYVEVYLSGRWVACTPAFNRTLCDMLNVDVLCFDGQTDSIFQSYNRSESRFMEYLEDYGTFADFPRDFVLGTMDQHYPKFKAARAKSQVFDLATLEG